MNNKFEIPKEIAEASLVEMDLLRFIKCHHFSISIDAEEGLAHYYEEPGDGKHRYYVYTISTMEDAAELKIAVSEAQNRFYMASFKTYTDHSDTSGITSDVYFGFGAKNQNTIRIRIYDANGNYSQKTLTPGVLNEMNTGLGLILKGIGVNNAGHAGHYFHEIMSEKIKTN